MLYLYVYLSNVLRDLKEEKGQGMAEYGLILALVAVLLIAAFTGLKDGISTVLSNVSAQFTGGGGG